MEHTLGFSREKLIDALTIICEYEKLFIEKEKNKEWANFILNHVQEVKEYMRQKIKEIH